MKYDTKRSKIINKISTKTGVSYMFTLLIVRGQRYTEIPELAIEVSKLTKKAPIEHIKPNLRNIFAKYMPELEVVPNNG